MKPLVAALLACALISPVLAQAQAYPSKPLRLIVPYPPGGTVDLVGRTVAQRLTEQLGQQIIVENRAGASGTIGSDVVARAAPDGYTLLVNASLHVANPLILKTVPFDAVKDFTAVSLIGSVQLVLATHPGVPATTFREFISLVKANPGKYTFATSSVGSASHLAEEMLKRQAGLDMLVVVYKGTAPALTDVIGGQVSAMIDAMPSSMGHIKGGRLRPLAVTGKARAQVLPEIPTVAESGFPDFEISSWYGIWGPAKLPREITARLATEISNAVKSKEVTERLAAQAFEPSGAGPAEFSTFIDAEIAKYARIVKEANIKAE